MRAKRLAPDAPEREARGGETGDLVRTVGIVGGGTAGYLAALALRAKVPGLEVTLVESKDVPIIGVGEATTPLMPQFLHADLGLDVGRLFTEVRPTFKLGIRFLWGPPGGDFPYPFGPLRVLEPLLYEGGLGACSLQALLMAAGAVPVYEEGGRLESRLGIRLAYHLDNERFVAYLRGRAEVAGVRHLTATIVQVETSPDGEEVAALLTGDGRRLAFDLYLDASGFRSLLMGQALASPWRSFAASLPTDRAVVAPVPHGGRLGPYTTAETYSAGWCWRIPQPEADHRGYVFASSFLSADEAEAEMRRLNPGLGEARLVRFTSGRRQHFWKGNVVALGNAYGFVEPLESTALHMLLRQVGMLLSAFPLRRGDRSLRPLLGRKLGAFWDYLAWFLALHYRFNRRLDSPFWLFCRAEVDVSRHAELLDAFRERGPLSCDPAIRSAFDYPDPLWGPEGVDVILLGQGVPCRLPQPALERADFEARVGKARTAAACALPQARALEAMTADPALLEPLAQAFRAVGPAFPVRPRAQPLD